MNYRIYFYVSWKEAEKEAPKEFLANQKIDKPIKMYLCNLTLDGKGNYELGATSIFAFADIFPRSLALLLQKDIIKTKTYLEEVHND